MEKRMEGALKKFLILLLVTALSLLAIAACGGSAAVEPETVLAVVEFAPATSSEAAPRELTLLLGAGEDTVTVNSFLPSQVSVRVNDTVTWKLNHTNEPHTVTFLSDGERPPASIPIPGEGPTDFQSAPRQDNPTRAPGAPVETYSGAGFVNSGFMANFNDNAEFSLNFDTPGVYEYVCLLHPQMTAAITVLPADALSAPSQADIDAQGQEESSILVAEAQALQDGLTKVNKEAGPNGTTIWHVEAGGIAFDQRAELYEFLAKEITIQEGDMVVWSSISPSIHTVTFHPGMPQPEFVTFEPQEAAPPILRINPDVMFPVKPAGEFDGTGYWNSGLMDTVGSPGGHAFTMTFTKAGIFDYMCTIHRGVGMVGTVTVVPARQ